MSPWVHVTAGVGPAECQWAVARVAEAIRAEAAGLGLVVEVLEAEPGEKPGTARSVLLEVDDVATPGWLGSWAGTVAWLGPSPFRPGHRRTRWFVGVAVLAPPPSTRWRSSELRVEAMPPGGPGGQHANKTASAVRVTHLPTGVSATAREARSQGRNRALAMARLAARLAEGDAAVAAEARTARWLAHHALARGNAVRTYEGPEFRRRP